MNILVFSNNLFPKPTANGICLLNILGEFERLGHNVVYIDREQSKVSKEVLDNNKYCFYYKKNLSSVSATSLIDKIAYVLYRTRTYFSFPRIDKVWVNKYVELASAYKKIDIVDAFLCVCGPVEAVEAAYRMKVKFPDKKMIVYNLDTVSNIPLPKLDQLCQKWLMYRAFNWEKKIFAEADVIINLKCHQYHFYKNKYSFFVKKMLFQDVPLLKNNDIVVEKTHCTRKTIIYAGAFYKDLREPSVLLNFFKGIDDKPGDSLKLEILTSPAYCNIIDKMTKHYPYIETIGYLSGSELDKKVKSADFLVSIGNKNSCMFPSKIVSYVAMGKPIIHIMQDNNDSVVPYLELYPDKLIIDNRQDVNENKKKLFDYLNKKHSLINQEVILDLYKGSTPNYNVNEILLAIQ